MPGSTIGGLSLPKTSSHLQTPDSRRGFDAAAVPLVHHPRAAATPSSTDTSVLHGP